MNDFTLDCFYCLKQQNCSDDVAQNVIKFIIAYAQAVETKDTKSIGKILYLLN